MKGEQLPVDELLRLACICAENDQREFLRAISETGNAELIADTKAFLQQLHAYRMRRWGKTGLENLLEKAVPVSVAEIAKGATFEEMA